MTQLQMSLSDVAALAGVERPVPSMWRQRSAGSERPFPEAVATVAGVDRFDADAVVTWLEETGRGKNQDARADAAAFALPRGVDPRTDRILFDALTSLLCLRVVTGEDVRGLAEEEVRRLAAAADPDDTFLHREVVAAGGHLGVLAGLADRRADAAFSSVEAFERLVSNQVDLALPVHHLVSRLASALASECGAPRATYVEPTGSGNDLVVSALLADAEESGTALSPGGESSSARAFRRRLRIHDLHLTATPESLATLGPAVIVVQLPAAGGREVDPSGMLHAIDELALSLSDDQRALIVAPASLLVDRLRTRSLTGHRADILRIGRLRAMVRLPAGLVTSRSRQALALWVLGPDHSGHELDQRRIATADVSDEPLTELLIGQLVDDVVAAMAEPRPARAHSFARARLVPTSAALASGDSLVSVKPAAQLTPDPAGSAVMVQQLRVDDRVSTDALDGLVVAPGPGQPLAATTVSQALAARALRMVPGNRAGFDLVDDGNVAVIGVPELTQGAHGQRYVDRLMFLGGWAANRLTEPGDVVFCTSPRPAAFVDVEGGSAVEYPARILRPHPVEGEGISPHALAHDVNGRPAGSRAWKSWPVRRVRASQLATLGEALTSVARERAAAAARTVELDTLTSTLLDAVTAGALTLDRRDP